MADNERIWASYARSLRRKSRSELTIDNYRVSWDALLRFIDVPITDITTSEIDDFLDARALLWQSSTVNRDYRNLSALFAFLTKQEWITRNPMLKVDRPEVEESNPRVLTNTELKDLIRVCRKSNTLIDRRDEAIIRLFSEPGGPRRAEMLIKLEDLDHRHDMVQLRGKTGDRVIPYGVRTGTALEKYMRIRDNHKYAHSEYLWLTHQGPAKHFTIYDMIRRRGKQAGLGNIHPHTLRHTAAHRCMEAGMTPGDMQSLFGWSSSAMLLVYARSTRKVRAQNSARKLALGDLI